MNKIALLLSIILIAGCSDRTPPEPEDQTVRPAKLLTLTGTDDQSTFEFTARIEALQTVDMSFEVGGPLANITIKEGETIERGALIAALDPTEFQLAVKEAEVQLRLSSQDLSRKREVLKENGIAKSLVEDAATNYQLQQVRLRKAKERLNDSRIFAPFDGYVSRRYFDSYVNVGPGVPIAKMLDLSQLQVVMSAPENLIATVSPERVIGAWVEFAFAPDRRFPMTFSENRGEADALAQTYEVSFLIENPADLNILPGMTATAKIEMRSSTSEAILVPASSVVPMPDGNLSVWVYNPGDQSVTRRQIETSAPTNHGVPVTQGLQIGEQIVIAGASQLQPGMKVRPL
ncbi:MAG: efflux RND transporter periplasmic adaptor subunit [Pseudomonadales bacterium]|nr:efflux RND transporter periplasmic adaptor subunit [Pseudomonadales bacterium]MBO6656837.1 efflux RND transporter periplasmic adaptor subunit [Pseudomonadales bacterium]MBO6701406.1 efflux RND transporter periplasmic adaptor subunit [Pseudomonadales bacterium]MBO7005636.1 efflux RND transporter periplasmic adaptor subunit [Pseudomonadales bacterium]